jgi:hypothetical protein
MAKRADERRRSAQREDVRSIGWLGIGLIFFFRKQIPKNTLRTIQEFLGNQVGWV